MAEPHAGAVFRAFSMPGRKPRGEWTVPAIEIGTRSKCALTLNDPVVAYHHCTIRWAGGEFVVEDQGSATGTWHNGVAVGSPVPLASGDQVVIGVTRLSFEVKEEEGRPALEVLVEEASFHYKKPKPGEFHTDADEWVRSEVRFGRIPAVRGIAWLAGLVAIGVFAWIFSTRSGERMLQPGRLDGSHAALFSADPGRLIHDGVLEKDADFETRLFADAFKKVGEQGCAVCHASSAPGNVSSCANCHSEKMSGGHPFYTGGAGDERLPALDVKRPADGCLLCHGGHERMTALGAKKLAQDHLELDSSFPEHGPDVCTSCHPPGSYDQPAAIEERLAKLKLAFAGSAGRDPRDRQAYEFEEFSHKSHLGAKIACAACHVPTPDAERPGAAGVDFKKITFESCAECHVQGMQLAGALPGMADLSSLRKRLEGKQQLVSLSWHGEGAECLRCHAQSRAPELKKVERELANRTYTFRRTAHRQFHGAPSEKTEDCSVCHRDLATLDGGVKVTADFLHGAHAETLWPKSREEQEGMSEQRCLKCHVEQWASATLGSAAKIDLGAACSRCHGDAARPASEAAVTAALGSRTTSRPTEFPHDKHAKVDGGCFACHGFQGPDDADPRATPILLEGVMDCTKCHSGHANIAGNSCMFCHPGGKDAATSNAVYFRGEKPFRNDWPSTLDFDHFAGTPEKGHRSFMESREGAPAGKGCAECHLLDDLEGAQRVSQVPLPGGSVCVDCHINQRGWFHWVLPEASK